MSRPLSTRTEMLFEAFLGIFGAQKMTTEWGDVEDEVRNREWEPMLARFDSRTINQALQGLREQGKGWPPSSGEFLTLLKQFNRPEHSEIPALPMPTVSKEQARANLAKIRAMTGTTFKRMPGVK